MRLQREPAAATGRCGDIGRRTMPGPAANRPNDSLFVGTLWIPIERMRLTSLPKKEELTPHKNLLDELVSCLAPLDKLRFEQKLNGAVAVIPFDEAVQRILLPLQLRVGELWHEDRLSIAVEHYVTKVLQQKLFSVMNQLPVNEFGPRVLIACPEGEHHELGAQAVAYLAAARGCHIYYLGSNLPLTDLQTFCESITPELVLLSLTESRSDEMAHRLLHQLQPIALRWPVAMGGQGAEVLEHLLERSKVEVLPDLAALHNRLASLLSMHQRAFR